MVGMSRHRRGNSPDLDKLGHLSLCWAGVTGTGASLCLVSP